jgi:hypothetical protein
MRINDIGNRGCDVTVKQRQNPLYERQSQPQSAEGTLKAGGLTIGIIRR